jgi:hypothetical protein
VQASTGDREAGDLKLAGERQSKPFIGGERQTFPVPMIRICKVGVSEYVLILGLKDSGCSDSTFGACRLFALLRGPS